MTDANHVDPLSGSKQNEKPPSEPAPDGFFNNEKGIDEIGGILAMRETSRTSASRLLSFILYAFLSLSALTILGVVYFVVRQATQPVDSNNPLYATDSYLTIANELKRLAGNEKALNSVALERVAELTGHADYGIQQMARVTLARSSGLFDYPDASRITLFGEGYIQVRWPDNEPPDYLAFGTIGSQQLNDLMKGLSVADIRAKTYQPIGLPVAPKPVVRLVPSLSRSE
ncbi:MAG: hypothetical protein ABIH86_03800 [Planctomycetota bacterium]